MDATKAAVELAEEKGIDLELVEGTGTDGKILQSDVEGFKLPEEAAKEQALEALEAIKAREKAVAAQEEACDDLAGAISAVHKAFAVPSGLEEQFEMVMTRLHYAERTLRGVAENQAAALQAEKRTL